MSDAGTAALINQLMNPPDPFVRAGQAIQGMNALQDYKANAAAAQAYKESIRPDGSFDQNHFNAIASQLPGGSWKFGTQMQQAGQGLQAQGVGTSADLEAKQAKLNGIAGQLYPLMKTVLENGTVTGADLQAAVDQARAMGLTTPDMLANMQKQIDRIGPTGTANDIVRGAMYGTLSGAQKLQALTGTPYPVNQGTSTIFAQPTPGAAQPGVPAIPMGLDPAQRAKIATDLQQPHPFTDDDGQHHPTATLGDFYKYKGINPYAIVTEPTAPMPRSFGPAPGGAAAPAAPAGRPPRPGRAGMPGEPSGYLTPPAAPGAPGGVVQPPGTIRPVEPSAGLSPEQVKAGRETYAADLQLHGTLGTRVGPLTQALSVLRAHPNMQTVGQEELYQMTQLAHAFGLNVGKLDSANAYAVLSKNLAQYMQGLPGANRSDLATNTAAASTPHIGQGRGAMEELLAKAVGLERMRTIGIEYFHKQQGGAEKAAKNDAQYFKTRDWLSKMDPVALAVDQMTPPQLKSYYDGLSATDKERFKASRDEVKKLHPNLKLPGAP